MGPIAQSQVGRLVGSRVIPSESQEHISLQRSNPQSLPNEKRCRRSSHYQTDARVRTDCESRRYWLLVSDSVEHFSSVLPRPAIARSLELPADRARCAVKWWQSVRLELVNPAEKLDRAISFPQVTTQGHFESEHHRGNDRSERNHPSLQWKRFSFANAE